MSGITRLAVAFTALWYAGRATLTEYPHPALGHVNSEREYGVIRERSLVWHGAQSNVVPPTETHVSTTDGHEATFVSPLAATKVACSRENRDAYGANAAASLAPHDIETTSALAAA